MDNYKHLTAIFFLGIFLSASILWAKEDTVYLSFRKSAAARPGTTVYTVKRGEWLLDIVRRVTGEKKNRLLIVRRYNPGIKDLNRIYPGQKLLLPVKEQKNSPSPTAADAPPAPPAAAERPQAMLSETPSFPSAGKWSLLKQLLAQIGATTTSRGKYYLPLTGMGQLTIDCQKIPLVEFPDRGMIFVDFRHQFPENVTQLIRQTWKNIAVIGIDSRLTAPEMLARLVGASGSHEMIRQTEPLFIGKQFQLQIRPEWVVLRKPAAASAPQRNIALCLRAEDNPALPGPIRGYAADNGWEITEISGEKILAPPSDENIAPLPVSRLSRRSFTEMAADLFERLELTATRDAKLKIFDSRRDGFDLTIKAGLQVSRGDRKLIIMDRRLPNQFVSILKTGYTEVIFPHPEETRKSFLERSCRSLGIPIEFGRFTLPLAAQGDSAAGNIVFSGLKIMTDKGGVIYLLAFDPGNGMNGYLAQVLGVPVITY